MPGERARAIRHDQDYLLHPPGAGMTEAIEQNGHATDAAQRVLDALGNEFTPESVAALQTSALSIEDAVRYGVRAVRHPDHVPEEIDRYWVMGLGRGPGMLFEWRDMERTVVQFRPDTPVTDAKGKGHKYVLPKDCGTFLNHLREAEDGEPVLFVEGTKQGIAAAVWAPDGWGVVAVPGCNNWVGTDLTWAEDRKIIVLFDGDVSSNRDVHDAAVKLKDALDSEGAENVVFAKLAGARAKDGLDDVLGRRPADKRTDYLARIAGKAAAKLGRAPSKKSDSPYMGDKGLLAKTASLAVLDGQPAALARGSMIALYRNGVFVVDMGKEPLIQQVKEMLEEDFRPNWRATIEEYLVGELYGRGMKLPEHSSEPLLNCANAMVDLRTGETHEHDPKYLSALQIPVLWQPDATCPTYEAWLEEVIPDQAEALEEVAATMLDPSRTPQKAAFLYGPSRSGKSTFLRILGGMAGSANMSAVSLRQLSDNKFMSAELYQKMLNAAAEVHSTHIEDTTLFKMLTGQDPIQADRKYGKTFTFTNRALFAFCANEIPTVSETSRAYVERMVPFNFARSFAGRENPGIEERMLRDELPGILARWVRAWKVFSERGSYLSIDPDVKEEFETRSDRIARWVSLRCDVHPEAVGQLVGPEAGDSVSSLYVAFKTWARDDGPAGVMSRPKFSERLRSVAGVGEVRLKHRNKNLGLNVTTHTGEDRERVSIRANPTNTGVGSVGSVGSQRTSLYVPLESETIKVSEGGTNSPTHRNIPELPTLPTPIHTPQVEPGVALTNLVDLGSELNRDDVPFTHCDGPGSKEDHYGVPDRSRVRGEAFSELGSGVPVQSGSDGEQVDRESWSDLRGASRGQDASSGEGSVGELPVSSEDVPGGCVEAGVRSGTPIGIDLETASGDALFTYGPEFVRLAGVIDKDGRTRTGVPPAELVEMINNASEVYGHNILGFDGLALAQWHGLDWDAFCAKAVDTEPLARQADPPRSRQKGSADRYDLDHIAVKLGVPGKVTGEGGLAALKRKHGGYDTIPQDDPDYHAYLAGDLKAAKAVREILPQGDYTRREHRIAALMGRMTLNGFKVDVPLLEERIRQGEEKKQAALSELARAYGLPLSRQVLRGPQKAKYSVTETFSSPLATTEGIEWLTGVWSRYGVHTPPRTDKGKLSTAADVLEGISRHQQCPEELKKIISLMGTVTTIRTVYQTAQKFLTPEGRVHPIVSMRQASGRGSVTGPGMTVFGKHNGRHTERDVFTADDGHVLITCDLSQVDMRAVAGHCQDPAYMRLFDVGRDAHQEIADLVGVTRQDAKAIGHGWNYGLGAKSMIEKGRDPELVHAFINGMAERFPRLIEWKEEVRELGASGAMLDNGFGRMMRCDPQYAYTVAPALMGQGTARDITCEVLLRLMDAHPEYAQYLRTWIHDEFVFSVPVEQAAEIGENIRQAFTWSWKGVPILCSTTDPALNWGSASVK